MLTLNQFESNLLLWTKGHYENPCAESFWPQIGRFYMEHYGMDEPYAEGIYHMVRELWKKIMNQLPNKDQLLEQYERETLPSKAQFYWGGKKFGFWYNHKTDKFNDEDLLKARIAVMCSMIGATEVKHYNYLPAQAFAGLELKKKD
jgi:hypothetical protein